MKQPGNKKSLKEYIETIAEIYTDLCPMEENLPSWILKCASISEEKNYGPEQVRTIVKDAIEREKRIRRTYESLKKQAIQNELDALFNQTTDII